MTLLINKKLTKSAIFRPCPLKPTMASQSSIDISLNKTFNAIRDFSKDLVETYKPTQASDPLMLYNRLVSKVTDNDAKREFVKGFEVFFENNDEHVLSGKLKDIQPGTVIRFKTHDKISIEIKKLLQSNKTDKETLISIREHLLVISNLIKPTEGKLSVLKSKNAPAKEITITDDGSPEAQLMINFTNKVKTSMDGKEMNGNPMSLLTNLMTSGTLSTLFTDFQKASETQELDKRKLLKNMFGAMESFMQDGYGDEVE